MNQDGILLIDKPSGITSRQVVSRVKSLTGVKKAGHTGTLDPLATGLLMVCMGRATLLSKILSEGSKRYSVEALLGVVTDSYDTDGEIISKTADVNVSMETIKERIDLFSGIIEQVPPEYSAVKYRGKPLYYYARKGIKIEPEPRQVNIESIKLVNMSKKETGTRIELDVICSPGTYIRSLVSDLGKSLGCGACVSGLRRLQSGKFSINDAVELESMISGVVNINDRIVSIEDASSHLPSVVVSGDGERGVRCGKPIERDWVRRGSGMIKPGQILRIVGVSGKVLAIYRADETGGENNYIAKALRVIRVDGCEVNKDEVA